MHFESQQELASQAGDAQQLIETLIVEKSKLSFFTLNR